jgi:hypothetical protein
MAKNLTRFLAAKPLGTVRLHLLAGSALPVLGYARFPLSPRLFDDDPGLATMVAASRTPQQ